MKTGNSNLKRPRHPMPDFVKEALDRQAKQQVTQQKRLAQMLEELEKGGVYMKMPHAPSAKKPSI